MFTDLPIDWNKIIFQESDNLFSISPIETSDIEYFQEVVAIFRKVEGRDFKIVKEHLCSYQGKDFVDLIMFRKIDQ